MRALLIVTLLSACATAPLPRPASPPCGEARPPPVPDELDQFAFLDGCWLDSVWNISICWRREPGRWVGEMLGVGALVITADRGELELIGWGAWDPPIRTLIASSVGRDEVAFGPSSVWVDFLYERRSDQLQIMWLTVLEPGREPCWVLFHRVPSGLRAS